MKTETLPTVAVVGPGAIGTTIAAALRDVGRTPMLCGRTSREHLTLHDGERTLTIPGPVHTHPAKVEHRVDLVLLAVKATQTHAAKDWLAALAGPHTVVCVLQNGVEQLETVTQYVPDGRTIPAVVWFPAQAQADGSVRLRGDARLSVPDTPDSCVIAQALQGTFCSVELAADFRSLAWRKLLQNAAAGLMALTQRRSGMFARSDIARLTLDYLQECLAVARAEGAELRDEVPQAILDKFQAAPADMGTSILTDRMADRPLEWEVRNGVISRRGRIHGIATPISDVLVPLLAAASDGPG
ncbi:2-dehydropantoate 2-reductase [Pandoraea vervacti]|uniref:2-dehydropantoate 2-reductase n=1 Tax=Pandoraea vervacti TaxID=656178 RepID=A0ABN4FPE0_9BURK|nr:oxidoreductase [Pandoraea vervacti]AJP57431.1 2-dehydropantoate 2-reductase [Pandoraea vervacti]